ncbi:MAG: TetR/AcrR family transcriptional regulator [Robiginitomaculum sp.]|nr:TetR/AcrR family transcriptional regulator [Robiginitomaculum sp.]
MTKTRSEKKQATREKILKAAYALFDEKGYDETSYTEIAERAGVGYGTIYTHFSSKENLLLEHYLELIYLQATHLQAFSGEEANSLQRGLDMIDTVWTLNLTSPIRRLTVFFSYRWVSSKEDYDRVLDALNAVLEPIGKTFEQAQAEKLLAKTITIPLVLDLIRAAYLHALQDARFGEDERKAAKKKFDGQVDYLLQIDRANFIGYSRNAL